MKAPNSEEYGSLLESLEMIGKTLQDARKT
jgi:hypothetical protein